MNLTSPGRSGRTVAFLLVSVAGWLCGRSLPLAHAECSEEGMYTGDGDFVLDLRSTDPEVDELWPVVRLHGPLLAEGAEWGTGTVRLQDGFEPMVLLLKPVLP